MPDDEAVDYLATQAIADFLATENEPLLDGIIFRSAQVQDGRNVVLFHKAAQVKAIELPHGTEIEARNGYETEDGWEVDYSVTERTPPASSPPAKQDSSPPFILQLSSQTYILEDDLREEALCIAPQSVEVHQVNWVEYNSTTYKVDRHRYEKHNWEF